MMPPDRKIVAESSAAAAATPGRMRFEPHEDEGDDGRGEDLEEAFDPQVNDPPSPVFDDRQMRVLAPGQPGAVEQRNRAGGNGEQRHQLLLLARAVAARASSTRSIRNSHSRSPTNSAICQARPRSTYS